MEDLLPICTYLRKVQVHIHIFNKDGDEYRDFIQIELGFVIFVTSLWMSLAGCKAYRSR